jgi:2,3-dihydroxy-p-cumate/2,3-dihydroxybenzoate 3,4-dioxygenase
MRTAGKAIMHLRSIELGLPNAGEAAAFLSGVWGALGTGALGGSHYIRGTAPLPYLVALREAAKASVASITFGADSRMIDAIASRAAAANIECEPVTSSDPGGGHGILVTFPDGEQFRFLTGCAESAAAEGNDAPVKLTHVVLNARDAELSAQMAEDVLGFTVSDRTKGMVFVRCNTSHHSIAFARADYTSLNHIAFEMHDLDAVMRGIGRMRDAGFVPAWGPGRHGPGANVFAYFIAPFGAVVEFSTAVEEVGPDYSVGTPDDWTWPPNRIDQWGMSDKQAEALQIAEKNFRFAKFTMTAF